MLEGFALKAIFGGAKDMLLGALKWVVEHPWQAIAIGAGAWLTWLLVFTIPGLKADLSAEVRTHKLTKQNYKTAQADADLRFAEARIRWEKRYAAQAQETDNAERQAREDAFGLARSFIANNRLRCEAGAPAVGPASGTAGEPAQGDVSQGGNGPGEVSELVAVPSSDVLICTENTTRLRAARENALSIMEQQQ